jgi:hypothetical protein
MQKDEDEAGGMRWWVKMWIIVGILMTMTVGVLCWR